MTEVYFTAIAESFEDLFNRVPYEYTGSEDYLEYTGFKDRDAFAKAVATAVEDAMLVEEYGTGSYDPSLRLTFGDGSVLQIDNPKQAAFMGMAWVDNRAYL